MTCREVPVHVAAKAKATRLFDLMRSARREVASTPCTGGVPGGRSADEPSRVVTPALRDWLLGRRAQLCTIIGVDIVGFGDDGRDDDVRDFLREAMYRLMKEAFNAARIPWQDCRWEDRGDGALIVVPPHLPTEELLDPLVEYVHAGVRRHNKMASPLAEMRMRMAVHNATVRLDENGVSGGAELIRLCRLLDAPAFKRALAASPAVFGLIASNYVYETVIRHSRGLVSPDTYSPLRVANKELRTIAWVYLPVHPIAHRTAPERSGQSVPHQRIHPRGAPRPVRSSPGHHCRSTPALDPARASRRLAS